jgi:hypothetical protein
MANTSPAKIKVPTLNQVALMVNDARKVAENYWNIFGIGPWDIFTLVSPTVFGETYLGKPADYGYNVGLCRSGPCQLELIEPLTGESMYKDFIDKHGEGLQHLQYLADTIDEAKEHVQLFADMGFPLLMDGYFGDGYWAYMDTVSALKCVWEVVKMPSSISAPHVRVPTDPNQQSPAKVKVKAITQVSLVVKDIRDTMKHYWNILGIGPWNILDAVPPVLHNTTYKGKPSDFTAKVGYAMVGEMQIELIEPVSGASNYNDFIAKHGEGLHHLRFLVDDVNKTTQIMNKGGFPTLMSGGLSDGGFAYYNTGNALKCIWEASQAPKTMPPLTRYP